jgi:predicted amidohydrolase YtcJ
MELSRRGFLSVVSMASLGSVSSLEAQAEPADLVLYNGKIVTVDDAFSIRETIVIKDGRIAAIGGNELRNHYAAARIIDLKGRTVIPGFHDSHIHLAGHSRRYIDFRDTTSLVQLKQQVSEKAKELGPGEWITGGKWDEYHFQGAEETLAWRSGRGGAQTIPCF